jgi:hypothetical protein
LKIASHRHLEHPSHGRQRQPCQASGLLLLLLLQLPFPLLQPLRCQLQRLLLLLQQLQREQQHPAHQTAWVLLLLLLDLQQRQRACVVCLG